MKDIIHILPTDVANQIAAGEVIQRPASIVKELVENSLDAGATRIQVIADDGGRTSIQVIDNGKGMSKTDARLSFERHATSKITDAADLCALSTMGFRGEALAAISSVAQVELRTRTAADELGVAVCREGLRTVSEESICCPVGAHFMVNNIFFNTPGRRRFLKSSRIEQEHITTEFDRIALAHPEVALSLASRDVVWKDLPASSFRERIANIFGRKLDKQLLKVEAVTDVVTLTGFVGSPETAKRKVPQQFFFVNGRYIQHGYFAKAVKTAFERLIPEGHSVPFFLHLVVDPAKIDVNIHPTKTEVKFEDDQSIYAILLSAVRKALGNFQAIPTIEFWTEVRPTPNTTHTLHTPHTPPAPRAGGVVTPFIERLSETRHSAPPARGAGGVIGGLRETEDIDLSAWDPHCTEYLQFQGRYLLAPVNSGLLLIDAHRAHYRILYDDFKKRAETSTSHTQHLIFPQKLDLTPQQNAHFELLKDELCALGFAFDGTAHEYSVTGIPSKSDGLDPVRLVTDILDEADPLEGASEAAAEVRVRLLHQAASTLARRSAIPVGQHLSSDEMKHMSAQLFESSNPNLTPDGKAIVNFMRSESITARFN